MSEPRILEAPLELEAVLAQTRSPACGGLVVFGGTVRDENAGRKVTKLSYSVYRPLAERALQRIEEQAINQYGVSVCRILHRVGELAIGDLSVLVVVRAPHRAEAFAAARYAIDTVKHSVPIWKYEEYADGTHAYVKGCALHQ